jgi:dipeptidyl aminopeptidase/acylaminoacyl peptidase
LLLTTTLAAQPIGAQQAYQRPPQDILDILRAPDFPVAIPSPTGEAMLLATRLRYKPISDLAEPMLPLAGVRINPRNNAVHGASYFVSYALRRLPQGPEVPIALPVHARAGYPMWNATGTRFAFSNTTETSVELWVGEVASASVRRIDGVALNPVLGHTMAWMGDRATLLVKTVPAGRGEPPVESNAPIGPRVEESGVVTSASSTYEARDLLKTPHDADRFEYHATAQLALVDLIAGTVTRVGGPDVLARVDPSPGGSHILVERVQRPYSFIRPYARFPREVEVWDVAGRTVETLASLPLAEQVPIDGVRTGPRGHSWRATAPATLVWAEALDGGDTYKAVPHHDRLALKTVGGAAKELCKTEQRFAGLQWIERGGLALLTDFDLDKHWTKVFLLDVDDPRKPPRLVWSLSSDDRYNHPGDAVERMLPSSAWAVREHDGAIFMAGDGASPQGNRPFLDRVDLKSLRVERLFRSSPDSLESFLDWVDPAAGTMLTRRESPTEPPNVHLRTIGAALPSPVAPGEAAFRSDTRPITSFPDPTPQLRRISKRLVTYRRPDGVELSFTLYLPPGYREGTRLPTVLWAYPLDYTDPGAAGQVVATPQAFTMITGASPIFLVLGGYAVLDDAAMPVVGPSETAYDTFLDQIVANAKAAIDKAVELGVTDPDRVGVAGHSHGALMTANLLAWSDLFRAGIARSGAYNHTLRPFGFQNERRTLYQADDTYLRLSPLLHADRIDEPLLLIHGERDANPGTVPLQSEKLYEAVRGVGGTARLVLLPLESHGYAARESVEHVVYEMLAWFDRHVRDATARTGAAAP